MAEWHGRKGRPWRRLVAQVRAEEPWCRHGCGRATGPVDHIIARSTRPDLAHERSNLQGLCAPCNGSKGQRHEGTYVCTGCASAGRTTSSPLAPTPAPLTTSRAW